MGDLLKRIAPVFFQDYVIVDIEDEFKNRCDFGNDIRQL